MIKEELSIVDTIASKLDTHILNTNTLGRGHVLLTDTNKNGMNTLILASDKSLSKDNAPLGVNGRLIMILFFNCIKSGRIG
jgi:hypothetical protein